LPILANAPRRRSEKSKSQHIIQMSTTYVGGKCYPYRTNEANPDIDARFFQSDTLLLYNLTDCYLPRTILPKTKTLILLNCEKNAVYYCCKSTIFPNLTTIVFLNTHPCDFTVPRRFPHVTFITNEKHRELNDVPLTQLQFDEKLVDTYYQKTRFQSEKEAKICIRKEWIPAKQYESSQETFWGARLLEQNQEALAKRFPTVLSTETQR